MSIRKPASTLDRFDYAVIGVLSTLLLATALIVWRGDRAGVRMLEVQPADGTQDVSSRAWIQIAFAAPMVQSEVEERLRISPPVDAVIRWSGSTLVWMPSRPLTYGETYTVTLAKGGQSLQGRQVVRDVAWTFRVGHPRILYLSPDEQERLQLFVLSPDGGAAMQLTHAPGDVWDYAVSPAGSTIAYSVMREDGGADLWQVERDGGDAELLLACPEASCMWPAWSADGKRLAYERKDLSMSVIGVRSGSLASRIWLSDPASGETVPLFEDDQVVGSGPQWSPVGQRLAFYSLSDAAVLVYDFATGESTRFETLSGTGSWGPDGRQMAIPDTTYRGEREVSYVARVDLKGGQALDLSQPEATGSSDRYWQDASPVWSPTKRPIWERLPGGRMAERWCTFG